MLLLVGLGNPGAQYAGNRHNIGFMALDAVARRVLARKFDGLRHDVRGGHGDAAQRGLRRGRP